MYLCSFGRSMITGSKESLFNSAGGVNNISETDSRIKSIKEKDKCLKYWFKKRDEIHALTSSIENAEENLLSNTDCLMNDNCKNHNNLNLENIESDNLMKISDHSYACRLNYISVNENRSETFEDHKLDNIIKKLNYNTSIRSQKNSDNAFDREKQWLKINTEHLYTKQVNTDDCCSDSKNNVGETLPLTKTSGDQNVNKTKCSTHNLGFENKNGGQYVLSKLISRGRAKTLGNKYILVSNSNFKRLVASNLVKPMPLLALNDCQIVTEKDSTVVCSDSRVDNCTDTNLGVQSVDKKFIDNKKLVIDNLIENNENICCFTHLRLVNDGNNNNNGNDDLSKLQNSEGQLDFSSLNEPSGNGINNVNSTKQFTVSNVLLDHSYSHRTEYLISHAEHTLRSNNNMGSNNYLKSLRKRVKSKVCVCCNNKKDIRSTHKSGTGLKICKKQKFIDKIRTEQIRRERNFGDYNSGSSINLTLNADGKINRDKILLPFLCTINNKISPDHNLLKTKDVQVSSNLRATVNNNSIVDKEKLKSFNRSDVEQNGVKSFMNFGNQVNPNWVDDNAVEMSSISNISSFVHSNHTNSVQILEREDNHFNRIQREHNYNENDSDQTYVTKVSDQRKCNICCHEENLNDKAKRLCPFNCFVRLNRIDHRVLCKRKFTVDGKSLVANESSTGFKRFEHSNDSSLEGNSCESGQSVVMDCGAILPEKRYKRFKDGSYIRVELMSRDNVKELKLNRVNENLTNNGVTCKENLNYNHKNDIKLKGNNCYQTRSSGMKCGTIRLSFQNNQRNPSKLDDISLKDFSILVRLNGLIDNNKCCSTEIKPPLGSNLLAGRNNDPVIGKKLKISKSSLDKCRSSALSRISCNSTQPTENVNQLELKMDCKQRNVTVTPELPTLNNNTTCSNQRKTCCTNVPRDISVSYSSDSINILPKNELYYHKSEISDKKIVNDNNLRKKVFRKTPIILLEDINEQVTFLENFSLRPVWAASKNRAVDKNNCKLKNRLCTLNKNYKVKYK